MPAPKTETLTIRLRPETKATLRQAAERESRSLANMLEVMIRDYRDRGQSPPPPSCHQEGIAR